MQDTSGMYDPVERSFREGLASSVLLLPYCEGCHQPHWYPRSFCPHCAHQKISLRPSSGVGSIYAITRLRSPGGPVSIAYIALDDGVTMLSNVIDDDGTASVGQQVEVVFPCKEGTPHPVFRLRKP